MRSCWETEHLHLAYSTDTIHSHAVWLRWRPSAAAVRMSPRLGKPGRCLVASQSTPDVSPRTDHQLALVRADLGCIHPACPNHFAAITSLHRFAPHTHTHTLKDLTCCVQSLPSVASRRAKLRWLTTHPHAQPSPLACNPGCRLVPAFPRLGGRAESLCTKSKACCTGG